MKTLGIITEYNPFHQGHAYMLERAKRKADADRVVVIMSGSFVQRGEPAIFDKWTRTAAALKNGADLVLELPVLFAAANAEAFARGAVRLLTESGIVDTLAFGSESGNLQELQEAAKILANETEEFQRLLKELLGEGLSYPAARAKVLETLSQINSDILSKPNDILGLEYLKALDYYSSPILPLTIRRKGDYNSLSLSNGYASASAVRKALTEENSTEAMLHLPENTHDLYNKALSIGTAPVFWDALMPALHYKLRTTSIEELKEIAEVTEGLENRILHSIDSCYSFDGFHQNKALHTHENSAYPASYSSGYQGIRGFVFPQSAENALCACTGLSEGSFRYSRRFNGAGKMPRSDKSEKSPRASK